MSVGVKKLIKHCLCKNDYAGNPSTYTSECNKVWVWWICKKGTCIKDSFDNLVMTCEETGNIWETVSINFIDEADHCFIEVIILAIIYVYCC